ncbi:hypothetical protein L1049_022358 [Liquidambar formosana]|uniref:Vesicle transport v-SNARE N-terminal domain-containing protein n=1 Tax=Liquidambar formosana TaxID=63359 RepID=A0AAP0RCR7_LIQFO
MSQVFEGYEGQYCELSANLSRKSTSAAILDECRLNQSSDRIKESRKTMLETEELGVSILQDLHQQRQSLLHANNTLHGVDDNIGKSKVLTAM